MVRTVPEIGLPRRPYPEESMSLKDQTVVILGGSSGIGLATAKAPLAEGAKVVITGRSRDRLQRARTGCRDHARARAPYVPHQGRPRTPFSEVHYRVPRL